MVCARGSVVCTIAIVEHEVNHHKEVFVFSVVFYPPCFNPIIPHAASARCNGAGLLVLLVSSAMAFRIGCVLLVGVLSVW